MIDNDALRALEFNRILQTIAAFTHSEPSARVIREIAPLPARAQIEERFGQVEEIRRLHQIGVPLRIAAFEDIAPLLAHVRPEGAVLDPRDLVVLIPVLEVLTVLSRQFAYRTDIPLLQEVGGFVTGFPEILETLSHSIDREGHILDTASKLLFELRTRKRNLTARIRKRLEEIVREKQVAIFLQDDFITQRNGRWVIPVRMDSKGMVQGVVHDVSGSGETAFMEPIEIISLANELENLIAEVKVEEIRIVREISRWIREEADGIEREFEALVKLDCLYAISVFAERLGAEIPSIGEAAAIRLVQARHPLLLLLRKEKGEEVVPLDLTLGTERDESTTMVITGPNAGGKTIALKTTGLLLLMALSGIPVSAASTSTFPLVDDLLVDIGDEQSIDSSLSTFSGHISTISRFLRRAGRRTLVLLDELGTGTEPLQGAALACAILNDLRDQGSLVIATTHLTEIVGFVHKSTGMVNASMDFDRERLTPLYRLRTGLPGQSHAIEIARRYGLPERIIEFATGMLGRMDTEFHELLAELQEQRRLQHEALEDAEKIRRQLAEEARRAADRRAAAEQERRNALEKALQEARQVVQDARREARGVLDEVKREKRREALKVLDERERRINGQLRAIHPEEALPAGEIGVGDTVFVTSLGYDAQVLAVDQRHERVRVKAGALEIDVPMAGVAPRRGKAARPAPRRGKQQVEEPEAESRLNLVGLRVDDAISRIEPFLNHASLAGMSEVTVIHGVGTGALMRAVREYLDSHPLVRELRSGEQAEGGSGVTVVTLR
ncbi:endonuclease MutS2 [Geobacter sp. DSM 9736]|uniref:endonuclease MutS2 n=1 Tax=Geobacter sp. DSM 9736 TaxID=1277350 RepID=UPI000B504014|nr:endonuclease MutS2 [Geobacter sp. DSM 9736]SNB46720.1 DNA mismatch repair protein MutS2 [Geobacter sp. DSM 9736]